MKKFLIVFIIIIGIVVGALFAIPLLFKDQIKASIDKGIADNVNATVYFNPDKIGISIFKNFPDLTFSLQDFGIVGKGVFEGDTLTAIDAFDITIDLKSIISGDQIRIRAINLTNPRIIVLVTEDGKANYDIAKPSEEIQSEQSASEANDLLIRIDQWSIVNGKVVYYDLSMNFLMALDGINHKGEGDFTLDVFDLTTSTVIERMLVNYDNMDYLKDKRIEADVTLSMDIPNSKYVFKQNKISLNDFSFGFDGFISMPSSDIEMDISFQGVDNSIKSLYSLIPGTFTEGYENIKADGKLAFDGYVKGIYSDNPESMPGFNISLAAEKGMIQYPDLPEAIKNINFNLQVGSADGNIDNTTVDLKSFHMDLGKNPIDANMLVKNLVDYNLKASIIAKIDLDDIMRMFPLEDTQLSGIIDGNVSIDGVYDSISSTIPAKGNIEIKGLNYVSSLLPEGFGIASSSVDISTTRINVKNFQGNAGKTDLNLSGYLSNYINYALKEDEVLEGKLYFKSKLVDVNEWMAAEEDSTSSEEVDTTAYEVIEVPKNIDFELQSTIAKVIYDNLTLNNVVGLIIVRDGIVKMEKVNFKTLDGDFMISGEYNTQEIEKPRFDFNLDIKQLSIPKAYQNFVSIQKLAPIAEIMEGKFSTNFKINGLLQKDMMPDLASLSGGGLLNILQATIKGSDSKVISGITTLTKMTGEGSNVSLSDVLMSAQILDGRVYLEPFNVKFGKNNALIAGSNGLDGSLDYKIKVDVPQDAVKAASSLVSSFTGQTLNVDAQNVKLNLGVTGNYGKPDIKILGAETGSSNQAAQKALKASVDAEKEKLQAEAEKKLEEEQKKAEEQLKNVTEEQKETLDKEVDKAKEKLDKLFKKKKGG